MLSATALECVRGERSLFTDLSFTLKPHSLLEVRGPNGSGKTSLLRMLCGLLPPASGSITWNGSNIYADRDEYNARLAYIGHLNGVKDELSASENLRYAARVAGLPYDIESITGALHAYGLEGFNDLPCKSLSQGQRRRVALARLHLSAVRPLWILDEPLNALDTGAVQTTRALLESHVERGGMVVLSTHQDLPLRAQNVQRMELKQP